MGVREWVVEGQVVGMNLELATVTYSMLLIAECIVAPFHLLDNCIPIVQFKVFYSLSECQNTDSSSYTCLLLPNNYYTSITVSAEYIYVVQ